ncbi:MAG TPA: hypothetical protein VGJ28_03930 [Micromonosporaceae bacterium]|jgi:hypothetical protein
MSQILGAIVGGLLAILGGIAVTYTSHARENAKGRREAQLKASADLLAALQTLVRRLIDLAFLAEKRSGDEALSTISRYHDATIQWNGAMYAALLVSPPSLVGVITALDHELDVLCDAAVARQWSRPDFRVERRQLGRLAATYLAKSRQIAGLPDLGLPSIWAWDTTSNGSSPEQQAASVT